MTIVRLTKLPLNSPADAETYFGLPKGSLVNFDRDELLTFMVAQTKATLTPAVKTAITNKATALGYTATFED